MDSRSPWALWPWHVVGVDRRFTTAVLLVRNDDGRLRRLVVVSYCRCGCRSFDVLTSPQSMDAVVDILRPCCVYVCISVHGDFRRSFLSHHHHRRR